ncbi:MAG: FAD-dependent oxidoreductase [Chloroflexi bacterium]|nr:FAD-dependent oxidoreductase [Chloroflexota bacterium]
MPSPVILIVDDEPQVLNAVERDLRRHYRSEYRIVKASSGAEALEAAKELKVRGAPLALFLADQRMPAMSGTEFLTEARKLYPEARKALLTAYADTEAAIASINTIGLDYYLMKPWDPPEQRLYPALDDLLSEWTHTVQLPYDGIRVAGTLWSAASHAVRDFLSLNHIPYQWLDIEKDSQARALVEAVDRDQSHLPVVFFPDGAALLAPDTHTLAGKVGLETRATQPFYDLIVIGGGPAGLATAVYGSSEGMRIALVERYATGGQAGTSSFIENYLGFPRGVTGGELARRATTQARRFGTEILTGVEATGVRVEGSYRYVTLSDGSELSCHALLIATGLLASKLDLPGIEPLTGAGVYYGAAVSEAARYRGQPVFVVGGANSAGQGALFLARYASKVTLVVRRAWLDQSKYLRDQIHATENIEVCFNTEVAAVHGTRHLESITVRKSEQGETATLPAAAMFIFIGSKPHTDFVAGLVERTEDGFVLTGEDLATDGRRPKGWTLQRDPYLLETSVPGIFAAGDVRHGTISRIATAVGQGGMVVSFVEQYLKTV